MKRFLLASALLAVVAGGSIVRGSRVLAPASTAAVEGAQITLDPSTRYQTIVGWEATAQAGQDYSPAFPVYQDQLYDLAVNDLGLTRLRLEAPSGLENTRDLYYAFKNGEITEKDWVAQLYGTVNDNNDPFTINWRGFSFGELDDAVERIVLPIKKRVEANGQRFWLNVDYVAFTGKITGSQRYVHDNPEEYAEFVQAVYQHLNDAYNLVPDGWEMILEPDNGQQNGWWSPSALHAAMTATERRLRGMGVTPYFTAPSTAGMANALTYADELSRSPKSPFWRELSYHRYGGVSEPTLQSIASRAQALGIQTAMLEQIGANYVTLHDDLKNGRNSAWQQYALAFPGNGDDGSKYYIIDDHDPQHPQISLSGSAVYLRQYFRYIRPSAVRIAAASDDASVDPVAFVNPDGSYVVVAKCTSAATLRIRGLAPGTYGVSYTSGGQSNFSASPVGLAPGATLSATIPGEGVITIFGS